MASAAGNQQQHRPARFEIEEGQDDLEDITLLLEAEERQLQQRSWWGR
jgi:hypothetical protein